VRGFNHAALKRLREQTGLNQEEFAELVGLARPNYVNFEKGRRRVGPTLLARFAEALGVEKRDLLRIKKMTLRDLRDLANRTQGEAASHLGFKSATSYTNIENGNAKMTDDQVDLLAEFFEVTPDEIRDAAARKSR